MGPELLAERVFGDKEKAAAWLNGPNSSLSGRRPIDLLNDEAGAAIDHGMFG